MKNSGNSALIWEWQGRSYALPISPGDVLTLARAVDAEGYPKLAVAWTLLQRAAWVNSQQGPKTLSQVVTSYAQPLNPAWFPEGEKHQAEVARLKRLGDEAGAQKEVKRAWSRKLKATKTWEALSPETREVVSSVLAGHAPSPVPEATHYWASRAPDFQGNQAAKPNLVLLDKGFGFGGNVFFAEKSKKDVSRVQLVNTEKLGDFGVAYAGMAGNQDVLTVGLSLALAWVAYKRGKKS